jgi:hypothetical protein
MVSKEEYTFDVSALTRAGFISALDPNTDRLARAMMVASTTTNKDIADIVESSIATCAMI